jgi:hypothetical protein
MVGGIIGHYTSDKKVEERETYRRHRTFENQPTQKKAPQSTPQTMLVIENAVAKPAKLTPGETVTLTITYAVLPSHPDETIEVTTSWQIWYGSELVGTSQVTAPGEVGHIHIPPHYLSPCLRMQKRASIVFGPASARPVPVIRGS